MPRIDFADDTRSLHNIGAFVMEYESRQNAFVDALVNRIGRVLITSKMWNNPWASFKKGYMELGETVEEIFVNIAKPHSFDPKDAEGTLYKREIPDVRAAFHTMNFQKFYKVTITNDQLRQAFLSWQGITDLIAKIVDSLYTGMQLDEYLTMKYMMVREMLNGGFYPVVTAPIAGDGADPEDAVTKFREYTNNLTFLKTTYNRSHVRESTAVADQVIIVPNAAEAVIGVKVLANAFNITEVQYLGERIAIDSFDFDGDDQARLAELFENDDTYVPITPEEIAKIQHVVACKVDKDWFMVFDNFMTFTQNYNGQGLYWQYFYHCWKTFSVSPFKNAILFTDQAPAITGVTVSPSKATLSDGATLQLTATVAGTGLVDKTVYWSVVGKSGTPITDYARVTDDGILHIYKGCSEAYPDGITVKATAVDGKSGSAAITLG